MFSVSTQGFCPQVLLQPDVSSLSCLFHSSARCPCSDFPPLCVVLPVLELLFCGFIQYVLCWVSLPSFSIHRMSSSLLSTVPLCGWPQTAFHSPRISMTLIRVTEVVTLFILVTGFPLLLLYELPNRSVSLQRPTWWFSASLAASG